MRRRQYLSVTASTLAVAGLAGCSGILGGGGGAGDDPESTVEAFIEALGDGDRERANELIHSDSPDGEIEEGEMEEMEDFTFNVEETELLSEDGDTAEVRVEYTIESSESEESMTQEQEYELRTENGNWRIWTAQDSG